MKNRCSRCHARLDGHRKTCPYCGTMVRKRRGNVRVSANVAQSGIGSAISNITLPALTGKHLLVLGAVAVAIVIVISMLGCGSCGACAACNACSSCGSCLSSSACASCGACTACDSCGACSSCGEEAEETGSVNGANYNCEYHHGSTLYYVEGEHLIALEDGFETGRIVVGGKGIECVYADDNYVYYIISGNVLRAPLSGQTAVSGADVQLGSVILSPQNVGLEKINGFALAEEDGLCYWGQKTDGTKVIRMTDREAPQMGDTIYTGKYSNVQCYRGGVYFVSGEEATDGQLFRADMKNGGVKLMFARKANYYTLSGGSLVVNVAEQPADGGWAVSSQLIYIDPRTGEEQQRFDSFPVIRGIAANDQWIYYSAADPVTGDTLVYRFSDEGKTHQLVFRKAGSYRLYGVAGSYFSMYGEDAYYICNYDQMPNFISIREHTVLDK